MKKNLILIFFISMLFVHASGHSNSDTINVPGKWSLGINLSPDYCFRTLINTSGSPYADMVIDSRNGYEQFKIGFSAGVVANYRISEKAFFEFGVSYSDKGYSSKKMELTFGDAIDPRYGFTYPTSSTSNLSGLLAVKFYYNHIYLDVPVRVLFAFGQKKTRLVTGIGVTSGFLLKSTQNIVYDSGDGSNSVSTYDQYETFNNFNLFSEVSIGVERQFGKKVTLRVQPVFKYGILKIIDAHVSAHLWSGGLNFGCYYHL